MEQLKIYIDRLKDDNEEVMHETLPPELLELNDKDLKFQPPVQVSGKVYVASDHLVIHLDLTATAILPCAICNAHIPHLVSLNGLYLTKPLSEIKGMIYDLKNEVRESILLHTPAFTECHEGKCPEREHIKKYLGTTKNKEDVVNFPFANLD